MTFLSDGEIVTQITCLDLTALRAADQRQRDNEQRFQSVFNLQFQFMVILSTRGEILMVNDLPLQAGGVDRDAVIGRPLWDTIWWRALPVMRESWPALLRKAAEADRPLLVEGQFNTGADEIRDIDVAITAVRDESGALAYFIFQANDITGRKAGELALRTSEARLVAAQTRANLGSWEYDFSEGRLWWSDHMFRLFDCDPADGPLALAAFAELIHPEDRHILDVDRPFGGRQSSGSVEFRTNPEIGTGAQFRCGVHL